MAGVGGGARAIAALQKKSARSKSWTRLPVCITWWLSGFVGGIDPEQRALLRERRTALLRSDQSSVIRVTAPHHPAYKKRHIFGHPGAHTTQELSQTHTTGGVSRAIIDVVTFSVWAPS